MQQTINCKRFPHQKKFIDSKKSVCALVTGYGGGKTFSEALKIIKNSIIDTGIPHQIVSPSFKMAKKTTIPAIKFILENKFSPPLIPYKDYRFNKSDFVFNIFRWNGEILIGSAKDPDSLKGSNLGSAILDEPGLMDRKAYEIMISRIRHPDSKILQTALGGTPEGLNWFYDLCEGDEIPTDFELIRGKTTDNPTLPKSYIDNLYDQYDDVLVRSYINGEFVNLAGMSAYHTFSDTIQGGNLYEGYKFNKNLPVLIGMDFNFDPMCSVIGQEFKLDGRLCLVILKEFFLHNCDTDAACEHIVSYIDSFGENNCELHVYPDPTFRGRHAHGSAKSDVALIKKGFSGKRYFVHAPNQSPMRKDRLNSVNRLFCNANDVRRLYINDSCRYLRKDLTHITKEEFLNGNIKDKDLGHISDALGYLVSSRYPIREKTGFAYNEKVIL